jgi:hypothetical protein
VIEKTLIVRVAASNKESLARIKDYIFFISLKDKNHSCDRCWVESVHQVGK